MPIQLLEPEVAAKIAAGEVIERPASVIKELMDNSIDAGATEIRVEIRGGGQPFMRITDNGRGISPGDLPLAFVRHATSKIHTAEELFALHTLGFRGEALASAAAVARVTITTRTAEDEVGTEMTVEGGNPQAPGPRGTPRGTLVTVRDLFFNVPARLKFLKSAAAEAAHVTALVQQYALAYPAIRFLLVSDGKQVFASPGNGDLRDAIRQVYGQEIAQVMLPVGRLPDTEPALSDDPFADWLDPEALPGPRRAPQAAPAAPVSTEEDEQGVQVWGYVSPPAVSRTNRQAQHFFVNGRAIGSRMLTFALEEAYHSLLMVNRHPLAVLNIQVDPAAVDANVHPTKSEVKFRQERQVFMAVQQAVREALAAHSPVPGFGTRSAEGWKLPDPSEATGNAPSPAAPTEQGTRLSPSDGAEDGLAPHLRGAQQGALGFDAPPALGWDAFESAELIETGPGAPASLAGGPALPAEDIAFGPTPQSPTSHPQIPPLRVVGQVANTYIITEGPDGMFLIDQHAAHERVLYEQVDRQMRGRSVPVQPLLQPLMLSLTPRQRADIEPLLPVLKEVGFDLELVAGREGGLRVDTIPAMFAGRVSVDDLMEMVDELLVGSPPDRWRDQLAITLACHSAVRAGKVMAPEEMRALVGQLERCRFPRLCAHGRPTMLHLSALQLEREFGRRG
jgi:DNA mismatch repair protein MutL